MKILSMMLAAFNVMSAIGCEQDASLDAYMLIDVSSSMEAHINNGIFAFVNTLASAVRQRDARGSLIVFGRHAKVAQPLTERAEDIETSLAKLASDEAQFTESGTNIGAGLDLVDVDKIPSSSEKRQVIVIVTDGKDSRERDQMGRFIPSYSVKKAKQLKNAGARIVVVSLASDSCTNCEDHLKRLASEPLLESFFSLGSDEGSLLQFTGDMNAMLGYVCAQVSSVSPLRFCNAQGLGGDSATSTSSVVSVFGSGFLGPKAAFSLQCRFEEIHILQDDSARIGSNAVMQATEDCVDEIPEHYPENSCSNFESKGFCKPDSLYETFMALHCAATCGFCQQPDVTTIAAVSDDEAAIIVTTSSAAAVVSDTELLCIAPNWNGNSVRRFRLTLIGAGAPRNADAIQLELTGIPCSSQSSDASRTAAPTNAFPVIRYSALQTPSPATPLTESPSFVPTASPSVSPSNVPTGTPTPVPSAIPTASPSAPPSWAPTSAPTQALTLPPVEADGDELESVIPQAEDKVSPIATTAAAAAGADVASSEPLYDSTFDGCPSWLQTVDSYRLALVVLVSSPAEQASDSAKCNQFEAASFLGAAGCLSLLALALCVMTARSCYRRCCCKRPRKVHRSHYLNSKRRAKFAAANRHIVDIPVSQWGDRLTIVSGSDELDRRYTFETDSFEYVM